MRESTVEAPARAVPGPRGHVVVCGLEGLGVRVVEELDRLGERIVVLASDVEPRYEAAVTGLGALLVRGDCADPVALGAAGVPGARAIVLTADSDVGNIHGALAATALDPGIHVVLRAFDEEFGRRVETLIPGSMALSTSAIAAPGFVSALTDDGGERRLDMLGRELVLRHTDPDAPEVLAVLADESREPVTLFPSATGVAWTADGDGSGSTPRDRWPLCIVDVSGDLARVGQASEMSTDAAAPGMFAGLGAPRPSMLRRIDRRFWILFLTILALVTASALVFQLLVGVGPVDAIYQAVKAILGSAGESVQRTIELRYFALGLAIVGAVLVAAFYGLIVDVILSARASSILGPQVSDARDHVVVLGLGSIGYRVASQLRDRGRKVVAADTKPDTRFADAARRRGVAVVTTDVRSADTLRVLRVDRARALVAATDDDAVNLAAALQARAARPDLRIVVRLFDADLATRLGQAFGGFECRSVSDLAAPAFAAAAVGREVLATIPVGSDRLLIVARVPIEPGSRADGSTVGAEEGSASSVERGGCRVLAVIDDDTVIWKPAAGEPLVGGKVLLIVATRRGMAIAMRRGLTGEDEPEAPSDRVGPTLNLPLVGEIRLPPQLDPAILGRAVDDLFRRLGID